MDWATHIAAMAGHTGDGIAGTITGIGITDLDDALLMRLEVGEIGTWDERFFYSPPFVWS